MIAREYGWTLNAILACTPRQVAAFHAQIARLQAADDLRALRTSTAPYQKKAALDTLVRELRAQATGKDDVPLIRSAADYQQWRNRIIQGD